MSWDNRLLLLLRKACRSSGSARPFCAADEDVYEDHHSLNERKIPAARSGRARRGDRIRFTHQRRPVFGARFHATAAVICNENESGFIHDVLQKVKELFPPGAGYMHDRIDDNASSHIGSAFIGASRTFPVNSGRLVRGTWQNIFLLELDGPRSRRNVNVHVIGV